MRLLLGPSRMGGAFLSLYMFSGFLGFLVSAHFSVPSLLQFNVFIHMSMKVGCDLVENYPAEALLNWDRPCAKIFVDIMGGATTFACKSQECQHAGLVYFDCYLYHVDV